MGAIIPLYKQGLQEMRSSLFRGIAFSLTVLGEKA